LVKLIFQGEGHIEDAPGRRGKKRKFSENEGGRKSNKRVATPRKGGGGAVSLKQQQTADVSKGLEAVSKANNKTKKNNKGRGHGKNIKKKGKQHRKTQKGTQ